MNWNELYAKDNQPTLDNVNGYVKNNLLSELCLYLESEFSVSPKMEHSCCSMQKGWNIKYKKSGKSLCTIYPMDGYFIVLVVIGERERMEADLVITTCSEYVQSLYSKTAASSGGKWLMVEVTEKCVLDDVIRLVNLRAQQKR